MKKVLVLIIALTLVLTASIVLANVSGSLHDLTTVGVGPHSTDTVTMCEMCHIPHGANTAAGRAPLWARQMNLPGDYNTYGTTIAGNTALDPAVNSLACLSCHDGTIGVFTTYKNSIQQAKAFNAGTGFLTANGSLDGAAYITDSNGDYNPVIGLDLTNDHPIGIVYDNTAAGLAPTAPVTYPLYTALGVLAGGTRVECSTCHDVHGNGAGSEHFLRAEKVDICQACHTGR